MAEWIIRSDFLRFGPWVAVSIAAHGLLLLSLQASHPVALQSPVVSSFRVQLLRQEEAAPKPVIAQTHTSSKSVHHNVSHRLPVRHRVIATQKSVSTTVAKPSRQLARKVVDKAQKVAMASGTVAHNKRGAAPQLSASAIKARESRVRNHLERYKYYPASARAHGIEGEVELDFALNKKGLAQSLSIVTGSGYAVLDDAALQTVQRAQPFPASGGEYRFRLRFSRL